MENLEHLTPYLLYNLKIQYEGRGKILGNLVSIHLSIKKYHSCTVRLDGKNYNERVHIRSIKPILHPLPEFKNYPDIMDEFSDYALDQFENAFFIMGGCNNRFDYVDYTVMKLMFKHHMDIFGLIKEGFAIDINTLK